MELPQEFSVKEDELGYECVCREPPGVLTLMPERVENPDDLPNLSRMLAGFLTRNGHPVATDELLPVTSVPGAQGFSWQYIDKENYHRFWLFGNKAAWILLSLICPDSQRNDFQLKMQDIVKSLRLAES